MRKFTASGLVLITIIMLLQGCGDDPVVPETDSRLTSRPGEPSVSPVTGLSPLGLSNGKDGYLYVPENYSPDQPAPLLVGLHGSGGQAENWLDYTDMAESRGFVFLAINSRDYSWDYLISGFGPDVHFLDAALLHTFDRCNIDPEQIALAGFSDGASYALSLGLVNGDLFSHLIAYSPGNIMNAGARTGSPDIFISHGSDDGVLSVSFTRDQIVPFLENEGYDVTYEEFDGAHSVPLEISEASLDWLF